jgi:hypothetical protein
VKQEVSAMRADVMVDPNVLTEPVEPPFLALPGWRRWRAELWDHLWPWRADTLPLTWRWATMLVALWVTLVWVMGAVGRIASPWLVAWWVAWSAIELLVRMRSKPYVKEGPWWGSRFRRATWLDLLAYVGFNRMLNKCSVRT